MTLFDSIISYLESRGLPYEIFHHRPVFTSDGAAELSDHPAAEGTKSLALQSEHGLCVVTVCGDDRVDFAKLRAALGAKRIRMSNEQVLVQEFGTEIGGLAPFGYPPNVPTLIAKRLFTQPHVYFNPGRNDVTVRVVGDVFREIAVDHKALLI